MKTTEEIKAAAREAQTARARLFSSRENFNSRLFKWHDDIITDMYDHNQFTPANSATAPTLEDFREAVKARKQKGFDFIKYSASEPLPAELLDTLSADYGFEGGKNLIMALTDIKTDAWKRNPDVVTLSIKDSDIAVPLTELEVRNYSKTSGADFTKRKMERYLGMAVSNADFNYFGAFIGGICAGACYAFSHGDTVMIDGLLVDVPMRNKYIATTLLADIADYYKKTMLLHADEDDTPKNMYAKMGFSVIDAEYEYFARGLLGEK